MEASTPTKPKLPPKPILREKEGLTSERYFREHPIASREKPPLAPKPVLLQKTAQCKIDTSGTTRKSLINNQKNHQSHSVRKHLDRSSSSDGGIEPQEIFDRQLSPVRLEAEQNDAEKTVQETHSSLQESQFVPCTSSTSSGGINIVNKDIVILEKLSKNNSYLHSSEHNTTLPLNECDSVQNLVKNRHIEESGTYFVKNLDISSPCVQISPPTPESISGDFVLVNTQRILDEIKLPIESCCNDLSLEYNASINNSVKKSNSTASCNSEELITSVSEVSATKIVSSVSDNDVVLRNKKPNDHTRVSWSEENINTRSRTNSIGDESFDGSHRTVRRRISSFFGSFGKGNKTREKRESSLFYCNPGGDSSQMESSDSGKDSLTSLNDSSATPNSNTNSVNSSLLTEGIEKSGVHNIVIEGGSNRSSLSDESIDVETHIKSERTDKENISAEDLLRRRQKKCFFIVNELMTSERAFVDDLRLLCYDLKNAVDDASNKQKSPVIPQSDFNKIINSLPQLLGLNEDLLKDIENRVEGWRDLSKVSDVIVKKGPFLKLYSLYIQSFEAQTNFLDDCCEKYRKFAQVVKDFENSDRCKKLALKHYMLKPIQRIPQYRLLLDDYLEHQDPDSPDYKDTEAALKIVCDVADHANASLKQGDHFSKLLSIQAQLGDYEIIKPGRHFIKEGELFKLSRKEMQQRFFILLSDCLLYTSYYGSMTGLKVKYKLQLAGMKISTSRSTECHTEFSIITSTRSFTLRAKSEEEQIAWVDTIKTAIKDYNSRQMTFCNKHIAPMSASVEPLKIGREAPVWIQDKRVTMCQICTEEFTITFRRHHCRACGKVVCGVCSDYKAPMLYLNFSADRVCIECYKYLGREFHDPEANMAGIVKEHFNLKDEELPQKMLELQGMFKKLGQSSGKKSAKKYIPQRLKEVTANDSGSQMSGWLHRRSRTRWKRLWFVLKEQVLYVYRASEDVVASESIPVLGYSVEPVPEYVCEELSGVHMSVFQLSHTGQQPLMFASADPLSADRWITCLQEATLLK